MRGNKKRRERKKPSKKKKQLLRDATMLRTQAREKEKRKEKKNPRINPKQSLFLPPCLEYPFAYGMGETFPPSLNI